MGAPFLIEMNKLGNPSLDNIEELLKGLKGTDVPTFASYKPVLGPVKEAAAGIEGAENIVIIGHGGSVTTFKGILGSLGWRYLEGRNFFIVDTVDPVYLGHLSESTDPEDTHVIAVSKSGNTLTVLEALSVFEGYPTTVVTDQGPGTLGEMAKEREWNIVQVPSDIGGRFSGGTASALLPALVLGIDADAYLEGLHEAYRSAREDDDLIDLSGALYLVERLGKRTLFIPVYSKGLSAFNDLVTQLFHETLSKGRKGITVLCYEGPECQHHTNQRILDGPEDVATLFVVAGQGGGKEVSWSGTSIQYKGVPLKQLEGYTLGRALESEYKGVMGSMDEIGAPYASLRLPQVDERTVGLYVGIMQYLAYYFAVLRRVDPFDQPAVEKAKEIALGRRRAFHED